MQRFLKWLILFSLIVVMSGFGWYAGQFQCLPQKDTSYLSFLILGIFYLNTLWCGIQTLRFKKREFGDNNYANRFKQQENIGWFTSEVLLSLGMLGTIIGFVMMLTTFDKIDLANTGTTSKFLKEFGIGMSTALYTTLYGLICSILLKLQYFNFSQGTHD